ncbi:hypothetical protein VIGAN_02266300 [Vigna angularis var. angularis]|uniref:AP180 N-terminal homology (ANTH) domain-containing protein n=1 Tax=Vigna angularis var. angularis TaxID=157739 RepID=A0A0S3RGP2_PHAAN|nr:hypothetical protein VIGAN_02266300 [Vigna angularis var. angularis]
MKKALKLAKFSGELKVAGESVKLYVAITVGVVELLDKAEWLSEFFETCKRLEFGRGRKFINIKMPPASFISTMEEYIKEAPSSLMLEHNNMDDNSERLINNNNASSTGDILTINDDVVDKPTNAYTENNMVVPQPAELMGLHDLLTGASEFEEKSLAMTFIPNENDENRTTPELGWEVALFAEPETYNGNITTEMENNREVGGMELWKDDDEMNAEKEESVSEFSSKVRFNPFDHEDEQFNMPSPNSLPNIPYELGEMPYQHLMQQQKKTANPFDPSTVPTHPTQTT